MRVLRILLAGAVALGCSGCAARLATAAVGAGQRPDPAQILAEADTDHDGRVTRAEYQAARAARFARLDRNHDGYVDADDLPRLARRRFEGRVEQLDRALDADGDGRISRAEFVDGPARLFDLADAHRDGGVDRAELQRLRERLAARNQGG